MKKAICVFIAFLLLLGGCSQNNSDLEKPAFTKTETGNLIDEQGFEYAHLANEGILYYLGDLGFVGSIEGEAKSSQHLGYSYQTGMFAIKGAESDNILIRRAPNNEWFFIYRKASLPEFDFSVDNCIRLEFIPGIDYTSNDIAHATCGDGISDKAEILAFLTEVRSQEDPHDAGLYDLIRKPNGTLENCYVYGVIYGYFEEEPNLVLRLEILSFNDLAYSVTIEGKEYVLPAQWLQRLENP